MPSPTGIGTYITNNTLHATKIDGCHSSDKEHRHSKGSPKQGGGVAERHNQPSYCWEKPPCSLQVTSAILQSVVKSGFDRHIYISGQHLTRTTLWSPPPSAGSGKFLAQTFTPTPVEVRVHRTRLSGKRAQADRCALRRDRDTNRRAFGLALDGVLLLPPRVISPRRSSTHLTQQPIHFVSKKKE